MNTITIFLIEVIATLVAALLVTGYLRPSLKRVLSDLCKTEERAQFWTVFCNILLIGLPVIISLGYRPKADGVEGLFFEAIGRLSGNLGAYLTALIVVGMAISFFALVAPKPAQTESK
jgi:hypothetical protein